MPALSAEKELHKYMIQLGALSLSHPSHGHSIVEKVFDNLMAKEASEITRRIASKTLAKIVAGPQSNEIDFLLTKLIDSPHLYHILTSLRLYLDISAQKHLAHVDFAKVLEALNHVMTLHLEEKECEPIADIVSIVVHQDTNSNVSSFLLVFFNFVIHSVW